MRSMKKAAIRRPAGADLVPPPTPPDTAEESRRKGGHILTSSRECLFVLDITVAVAVETVAVGRREAVRGARAGGGDEAVFAPPPIRGGVGLALLSAPFCRLTHSHTHSVRLRLRLQLLRPPT